MNDSVSLSGLAKQMVLAELLDEKTSLVFVSHDQQLRSRFDRALDMQAFRANSIAAASASEVQA